MTRNNTLNKVHVAATELSQLLSQNTNMFGVATAQSRCQTSCSSKVNWKNCWKSRGHVPQCSTAGDAIRRCRVIEHDRDTLLVILLATEHHHAPKLPCFGQWPGYKGVNSLPIVVVQPASLQGVEPATTWSQVRRPTHSTPQHPVSDTVEILEGAQSPTRSEIENVVVYYGRPV